MLAIEEENMDTTLIGFFGVIVGALFAPPTTLMELVMSSKVEISKPIVSIVVIV